MGFEDHTGKGYAIDVTHIEARVWALVNCIATTGTKVILMIALSRSDLISERLNKGVQHESISRHIMLKTFLEQVMRMIHDYGILPNIINNPTKQPARQPSSQPILHHYWWLWFKELILYRKCQSLPLPTGYSLPAWRSGFVNGLGSWFFFDHKNRRVMLNGTPYILGAATGLSHTQM